MLAARLVATDMVSPQWDCVASMALAANAERLRAAGCEAPEPRQGVSAFALPSDIMEYVAVYVAGSLAGRDPDGRRLNHWSESNHVRFNDDVFSMLSAGARRRQAW